MLLWQCAQAQQSQSLLYDQLPAYLVVSIKNTLYASYMNISTKRHLLGHSASEIVWSSETQLHKTVSFRNQKHEAAHGLLASNIAVSHFLMLFISNMDAYLPGASIHHIIFTKYIIECISGTCLPPSDNSSVLWPTSGSQRHRLRGTALSD